MTSRQLIEKFNNNSWPVPCALIEYNGERGIAFEIGENLSSTWPSGEVIVFWQDGTHTVLPNEFNLVQFNVWYLDFEGLR